MSLGGAWRTKNLGLSPTLILCLVSEVPTILASSIPPTILVWLVEHGLTTLTGLITLGLGRGFRFPRFGRLWLLRWFMSRRMCWFLSGAFRGFMCCIRSKCWLTWDCWLDIIIQLANVVGAEKNGYVANVNSITHMTWDCWLMWYSWA